MCTAIDQATRLTTLAGASLRSSCAHPKGFRRSASFPRRDTTHPATKSFQSFFNSMGYACLLACGIELFASTAFARIPVQSTPLPTHGQDLNEGCEVYSHTQAAKEDGQPSIVYAVPIHLISGMTSA